MPSLMVRMLQLLDVIDGSRVLEIGTATGYNAAVLCHRLGADQVASTELHPGLAAEAAEHLCGSGYSCGVDRSTRARRADCHRPTGRAGLQPRRTRQEGTRHCAGPAARPARTLHVAALHSAVPRATLPADGPGRAHPDSPARRAAVRSWAERRVWGWSSPRARRWRVRVSSPSWRACSYCPNSRRVAARKVAERRV
jgi:hypothetical protein